jgi:hypothetical protein
VPVSPAVVDAIEAISARGRSKLSTGWALAVDTLNAAGERGATQSIAMFSVFPPGSGAGMPGDVGDVIRQLDEHPRRRSSTPFVMTFDVAGPGAEPKSRLAAVRRGEDAHVTLRSALPDLLTPAALGAEVECSTAEGVTVREVPERWRLGRQPLEMGTVYVEVPRRLVLALTVPPRDTVGAVTLGEIGVRLAPADDPDEKTERRFPLAVTVVPETEPGAFDVDPDVARIVAERTYRAVKDQWDRGILLAGTRNALSDAASELRAMGDVGAPWAERLEHRVAELDVDRRRTERVLDWLDHAPGARLSIIGEAHGAVGWVSVEALPASRARKVSEDGRRLLMARVARTAANVEEAASGSPATVYRAGLLDETLGSIEDGYFAEQDWRLDPESGFVPKPVPEEIVRWWEENRGSVSVRCSLHGEIARFDASRSIGMLGAAWDAAVVEHHNRWETSWDERYDTPEYEGCDVRIEPTEERDGPDLLDVEQMWIVLEGRVRPWWPYELVPGPRR